MTTEAPRAVDQAAEFLQRELSAEPRRSSEVKALARDQGISERTLQRAAAKLEVETQGGGPATTWRISPDDRARAAEGVIPQSELERALQIALLSGSANFMRLADAGYGGAHLVGDLVYLTAQFQTQDPVLAALQRELAVLGLVFGVELELVDHGVEGPSFERWAAERPASGVERLEARLQRGLRDALVRATGHRCNPEPLIAERGGRVFLCAVHHITCPQRQEWERELALISEEVGRELHTAAPEAPNYDEGTPRNESLYRR